MQCYGEGPVVNVEPNVLDFGAIEVLQNVPRHVNISNESLIPAAFSVCLVSPRSVFTVEPTSGQIAPLGRSTLVVTANLDDSLQCALTFYVYFEKCLLNQYILVYTYIFERYAN